MAEPTLLSIAVAVVTKAVTGLYELVVDKFADDPAASDLLAAAEEAGPESPEVAELADALEQAEREDEVFGRRLRATWASTVTVTQTGRVTNQLSGTVHGKVVQAGDIHGDVRF